MTEIARPVLLTVDNLCIGVPDPRFRTLVKNVRFSLEAGEILGIVGESGSGKTLMACALCGLLPPPLKVFDGRVFFRGRRIDLKDTKNPGIKRGRDLLMLFQSPSSALDPTAPVGAQIAETLRAADRCGRHASNRRSRELMEMVGLPHTQFDCYPFQLSGGQRQRVLLAMAFGLRPWVLIADEPTAGQDDDNRDRILRLLVQLQCETGVAAVVISHDLRVLSRLARKLVVLYRGKQVEAGPASDILSRPAHPHTRELIDAMRYLEHRP